MFEGTAYIEGLEASDKLFFDLDGNVSTTFPFVGTHLVQNGSWIASDGVLGLGRGENGQSQTIDTLYNASLISDRMFTLSLGNPNAESDLVIGGIPDHIPYENITWNTVTEPEYWNLKLYQMDFNDMIEKKQYAKKVSFSTLNQVLLPQKDFDQWWAFVSRVQICGTFEHRPACYCNSITEFAHISFQFDRYEYILKPESYIDVIPGKDQNICVFDILGYQNDETAPIVTLGLGFLRSFDVVFDLENGKIGIYSNQTGLVIDHGEHHGLSITWDIVLGVLAFLFLVGVILLVFCLCKRRRE